MVPVFRTPRGKLISARAPYANARRKKRDYDCCGIASREVGDFEPGTQFVYCLCMATKTISIETDAYELLAREKKDRTESFSRVIRRLFAERPALTAGDLLEGLEEVIAEWAGPRRKRR